MTREQGVFQLRTAGDLLEKLRFDFARLEANPLDQYAAFDLFVTASHLPDWLYPGMDDAARRARAVVRASSVLLEICDYIANGSKHFEAVAARHQSVDRTELHLGEFSREFSREFNISELSVHLKGTAAQQFGSSVDTFDLARQVLQHWEAQLGNNEVASSPGN